MYGTVRAYYITVLLQGALVIIGANTTVQPLVGTLFQLAFLLVVLKLAPYQGDEDDVASFWSSLALTLTNILSVMLLYELHSKEVFQFFHPESIGAAMIAINVSCLVLQIGLMVRSKLRTRVDATATAAPSSGARTTAVVPVGGGDGHEKQAEETVASIDPACIKGWA